MWVIPLINAQVSIFLTNVELPYTTYSCYYQHSLSSVSLSIKLPLNVSSFLSYTLIPPLTLFNETLYPQPCEDTFDISEQVPSLELKARDTTVGVNMREHFTVWDFYIYEQHAFVRDKPHTHPKPLGDRCVGFPTYKCSSIHISNQCGTF